MTDMGLRLDAVGIVVSDLAASVRFYRLLGLEFPEPGPDEGHLEAVTDTGLRLMLDLESVVRTCDPGWTRPDGQSIGLSAPARQRSTPLSSESWGRGSVASLRRGTRSGASDTPK
jgi:hypothetical protein